MGGAKENMSHTSGNISLHMIFSTRGRRPLITSDFRADLFAYLGGIIREMGGTAVIINGTADHVHMLLRIRPAQSSAQIARVMKANSSRWVHEKWDSKFAWQTGYGVFSVSESNVAAVTKYIAEQEEHHEKHSSPRRKFVAFLKKNNVAYDERGTSGINFRSCSPDERSAAKWREECSRARKPWATTRLKSGSAGGSKRICLPQNIAPSNLRPTRPTRISIYISYAPMGLR